MIEKGGGLVLFDDLAVTHKDDPVGHFPSEPHSMGDDQHGDALPGEVYHVIQHLSHQFGI